MIAPQVCDFTTVEAIGKMKIQFWKDTIEDIYSKVQYLMMDWIKWCLDKVY